MPDDIALEAHSRIRWVRWLQERWSAIRELLHGLRIAWVSAASVGVGFLLFFMTNEAPDLFLEGSGYWLSDLFYWAVFNIIVIVFWAAPVFISARWILTCFEEGPDAHRHVRPVAGWARRMVPPLLAVSCFLAVFAGQTSALLYAPKIDDSFKDRIIAKLDVKIKAEKERIDKICAGKTDWDKFACQPFFSFKQVMREGERGLLEETDARLVFHFGFYLAAVVLFLWYLLKRLSNRLASANAMTRRSLIFPVLAALFLIYTGFNVIAFYFLGAVSFLSALLTEKLVSFIYFPGNLLIFPGVLFLLWRGNRRAVSLAGTISWWAGSVLIFAPLVVIGLLAFITFLYGIYESKSPFGLGYLILLPFLTLILAYIAWWGLRPRPEGRATKFGQYFLWVADKMSKRAAEKIIRLGDDRAMTMLVSPLFKVLSALSFIFMAVIIILHPLQVSHYLNRAWLLPVILGLPVAVFTYFTHWSLRCRAPLVVAFIVIVGFAGVLFSRDDPYRVRSLDGGTGERFTLKDSVAHWAKANRCDLRLPGSCPAPIIVAAAGGASRAAFFMAGALGTLMDQDLWTDPRGHKSTVIAAMFALNGNRFVTASYDGTARLWNGATGELIEVLNGHDSDVNSAVFNQEGSRIVTASDDSTARLWNAVTGKEIRVLKGHEDWVRSAVFSPNGKRIVTTSNDDTARLWDAATGEAVVVAATGEAVVLEHKGNVNSAVYSPDGSRIVTASNDNTARLWDAATGRAVIPAATGKAVVLEHKGSVNSAVFSPDSRLIVTASDDKKARLWDGISGALITVLKGHKDPVRSAVFSPKGKLIVTASEDGTARLWDGISGAPIMVLEGHKSGVNSAVFSPNGMRIVTASDDDTARLWDTVTGKQIKVLDVHKDDVNSAVFSADGRRIVTASSDKTVRLWSTATGEPIIRKEKIRRFSEQLFAISAVSGGALGAAVTYAALADSQIPHRATNGLSNPPCLKDPKDSDWFRSPERYVSEGPDRVKKAANLDKSWRDCLQLLLAGDFLSPVVLSLVGSDPFYLRFAGRGNRAVVLEHAWEDRYARLTGHYQRMTKEERKEYGLGPMRKTDHKVESKRSTLARSMSTLRRAVIGDGTNGTWLPVLLFNGTSASNGRRIVTSDIDTLERDEKGDVTGRIFHDAYDLHNLLEHSWKNRAGKDGGEKDAAEKACKNCDIPLSTAVTMSARFPVISPPGHILVEGGKLADRVVDGGYYENFGATTAMELAAAMTKLAEKEKWELPDPVVVLINNYPFPLGMKCVEEKTLEPPKELPKLWFPSISAPFNALYGTQTARGTHAAVNLCNLVKKSNFAFISVETTGEELPLSWWLSKHVQKKLDDDTDRINGPGFLKINQARRIDRKKNPGPGAFAAPLLTSQ